uniref:RGS domain-containing protein n=1 Tax=Caenorhabditis tropicalis TaxID=1561998 RepID=A0A1I7T9Q5_9PELO
MELAEGSVELNPRNQIKLRRNSKHAPIHDPRVLKMSLERQQTVVETATAQSSNNEIKTEKRNDAWEKLVDEWKNTFSEFPFLERLWGVTQLDDYKISKINSVIGDPITAVFGENARGNPQEFKELELRRFRKAANIRFEYYVKKLIEKSMKKFNTIFPFWAYLTHDQRLQAEEEFGKKAHLPDLELQRIGVPDIVIGFFRGNQSISERSRELLSRLIANVLFTSEQKNQILNLAFERHPSDEKLFIKKTRSLCQSDCVIRECFKQLSLKPEPQPDYFASPAMKKFIMDVVEQNQGRPPTETGYVFGMPMFAPLNSRDFLEMQQLGISLNKDSITLGLLLRGAYQYWLNQEWLVPNVPEQPFDTLVAVWNFAISNRTLIAEWLKSLRIEQGVAAGKKMPRKRFHTSEDSPLSVGSKLIQELKKKKLMEESTHMVPVKTEVA